MDDEALWTASGARTWVTVLSLCGAAMLVGGVAPGNDPVHRGVEAYQRGECERAKALLRVPFERRPARVDTRYGAVSFWLGKAYEACEQPDSMRWAWRKGVQALRSDGSFDARLYDAHLWANWTRSEAERRPLMKVYRTLLRRAGTTLRVEDRHVVRRHVAQMAPLLNERHWGRLLKEGERETPEAWTFREGAGEWLLAWWRRQDPLPATAVNERLEEHLDRVETAQASFSAAERAAEWDERGDLYVRYGAPARRDSISFASTRFHREVIRFGVGVHRGDFPKNEIWSYPRVGKRGHYLFVRRKGRYQLGKAMDLIPSVLKHNFHSADRSQNRAYSAMAALRYVYRHLAMHYNMESSAAYADLAAYFTEQEALQGILGSNPSAAVGAGSGERTVRGRKPPNEVAAETIQESRHKQRNFVRKRASEMPQQHSDVATTEQPLPVEVRTARFLEGDGGTRAEVYWGGNFTEGELSSDRQVVDVSFVQHGPDYARRKRESTQYVFEVDGGPEGTRRLAPEVLTMVGDTDPFHLSLQWDRYDAHTRGGTTQIGEQTGRHTLRVDSLQPLSADPTQLEMSDLRPMIVPEGSEFNPATPTATAEPYPFSTLTAEASVLLYFEVYHLTYDPQDQTRYEVSYEMRRETDDGGFLGLGGSDTERTVATTSYTAASRTVTEVVQLDWGDATPEEPQPVQVTVQVEDLVSGQKVERSLNFRLRPEKESR